MMRERTLAIAHYTVIVIAVLVSAACAAKPTPTFDNPLPLVERRIFVGLPDARTGTLTAAQKREYDDGRRMVSHTRRRCVGERDPKTFQCDSTVDVQITAVEGAKYVDSTPPNKPQLIAWIENLSSQNTSEGLLPGRQARYALVVDTVVEKTRQGNRPKLVLVQIDNPEKPPIAPFSARQRDYGHVFQCHKYRQPYLSDVDFRPCYRPLVSVVPETALWKGEVLATSLLTFAATVSADDPTWFSCSSGCCTSAYPY